MSIQAVRLHLLIQLQYMIYNIYLPDRIQPHLPQPQPQTLPDDGHSIAPCQVPLSDIVCCGHDSSHYDGPAALRDQHRKINAEG